MTAVAKALDLLDFFSTGTPEIGLSELCRMARRDKATTYRYLSALEIGGLVEQNPATKAWRIGPGVLHLARLREETVPRRAGALPALKQLAAATGETAHVAVLSGLSLHALACEMSSAHRMRAIIDVTRLPLHATASGLCALAFGPAALWESLSANCLDRYTPHTTTQLDDLGDLVAQARASGFSICDRGLDEDVFSVAAPLYDASTTLAGTVAVTAIARRVTSELKHRIFQSLTEAAQDITRNWGGSLPAHTTAPTQRGSTA